MHQKTAKIIHGKHSKIYKR